jgi:hypothetical protein
MTKSRKAIIAALKESSLGPVQKLKVRVALLSDAHVAEIEQYIFQEAQAQNCIASDVSIEAVDWDKLIELIEKLLPLILKIIAMF